MKRSGPLKRKTPLGSNRKRRAVKLDRNFGSEADAVRAMPCLVRAATVEAVNRGSFENENCNCLGPIVSAHVTARGMGGVKGGRFDLVPLCESHHREAGEARTSDRAAFEQRYGLDLRAEADRIAVGHPRPLGIGGLADRWAVFSDEISAHVADRGAQALRRHGLRPGPGRLNGYELGALLGWVRRRIEVEAKHATDGDHACDDELLVWCIEVDLGIENSAAWALVEEARSA